MLKIGVMASGKGSNLRAIIDFIKEHKPGFNIGAVISDNPDSPALDMAEAEGISSYYIPPGEAETFLEPGIEEKYTEVLLGNRVELLCLAGFMRILKGSLLETFENRIVNIHPSLLPSFPGLEAWKQALEYGVRFSGCTTHFVNREMDSGPIIMQAVVPVLEKDSAESLHKRIQVKEHFIYPLTIKLIAEKRVSISGRRVHLD